MYPKELRYTKTHEWARGDNGFITVGITSFAVEELSDVVYVELPSEGGKVEKGSSFATLESVKAVSEVYSPVSGEIHKVNHRLQKHPELLSKDCYGEGWMISVIPAEAEELNSLMNAEEYQRFAEESSKI